MKQVEPKQETLDEAIERLYYTKGLESLAFEEGAKWKQQQNKNLYSEEEVYQILSKFRELRLIDFQEWFEQFKKK